MLTVNPDISESDEVAKSCPVSCGTINQYGDRTCRPTFSRVNPDIIRCMRTGEFDLNELRVDGEIFEFGKSVDGTQTKRFWRSKVISIY